MENQIKVVQLGLGPIGMESAKLVMQKADLKLVGGVDIDPEKVGVDLGVVLNLGRELGVTVSDETDRVLAETKPNVVLHSTGSFLNRVEEQLRICIEARASIISSCEELFYPFRRDADFCNRIDDLAKQCGVTVMGTGVNPGFSMDVLPLVMSGVCKKVTNITATRIVDASKRRLPLQKKIGAGLQPAAFRELVAKGKLGHIGLVESLTAVADTLKLELDQIEETIDPKVADRLVETPHMVVQADNVSGILHVARGLKKGQESIKLELQMFVGAKEESDSISIKGDPEINLTVEGGIFGDAATVARMVNAIPIVYAARPGLTTAMELPVPYCLA